MAKDRALRATRYRALPLLVQATPANPRAPQMPTAQVASVKTAAVACAGRARIAALQTSALQVHASMAFAATVRVQACVNFVRLRKRGVHA